MPASTLELVSPERFFAPEMGGMNHVPYMRAFHEKGVRMTINTRLRSVRRDGNVLVATLSSDFAGGWRDERRVDQVVVEHGTLPLDDLYLALKPLSKNGGAVDYERLVDGGDIFPEIRPGGFVAVSHRRRGRFAQYPRRGLRRYPLRDADLSAFTSFRGGLHARLPCSTVNFARSGCGRRARRGPGRRASGRRSSSPGPVRSRSTAASSVRLRSRRLPR